jgi:calcium-dependent protein kinase
MFDKVGNSNFMFKDGSGSVTIDELKEIFGGGKLAENLWKELVEEVDKNKDGEVSYHYSNF